MNRKHPIFGVFFAIIIFSIPIFNQLHFSLIDHTETINNQKKEVIHHQCQHFTFYTVFLDSHDEPKIEELINDNYRHVIHTKLAEHHFVAAMESSLSRGPPCFRS